MKKYDTIIIGGGPAAIVTGTTAKKLHPEKTMLMLTEEEKGLVPCGIPYVFYALDGIEKNMMGKKPFIDAGGDVLVDPATEVNTDKKIVKTQSGQNFEYDKLVFATGSTPLVPDFMPGYDLKNTFYIRKSYQYMKWMMNETDSMQKIVIIGGGFIGAEVAEQMAGHKNKSVTLIESEKNCFSKAFSEELSALATEKLRETNVNVRTSSLVEEVMGENGAVKAVKLKGGEIIEADAVIFAIGYKPRTELAKCAGLPLNKMGAIVVDNYERTSVEDVSAVGDCSQTIGFLTGRLDNIMLASTATAEARILGHNLYGVKIKKYFPGTLGIFSTEIGGLALAGAGLNCTNSKGANIEFVSASFTDIDRHPGTFADTKPLTVKLYVSPSNGAILGGEAWGGKSVGSLINTIGMAIQKEVTIYELISYQIGTHPLLTGPPTKPVLVKTAEAIIQKLHKATHPVEV